MASADHLGLATSESINMPPASSFVKISAKLMVLATIIPRAMSVKGIATYYGGNTGGGNCMLTSYSLPSGVYGTALAGPNWDSAAQCGACVQVTGPQGNSINAMAHTTGLSAFEYARNKSAADLKTFHQVVDQCPGCEPDQLDLFQNGFAQLAPLQTGIMNITWKTVPCGITAPLTLRSKDGASQWWFSLQALNSNHPITALEVSTDGGSTWQATVRRDYNYFERVSGGGFGTPSVMVRVSCVNGAKVTVGGVSVSGGAITGGGGNC